MRLKLSDGSKLGGASTSTSKFLETLMLRIVFPALFLAVLSHAQAVPPQERSSSWAVNNFCQLDSDGRRLDAPGKLGKLGNRGQTGRSPFSATG